jgi:hypothetical protein
VLGGLLLAVPDWARLSIIRASVLPVVRHSRRTVLMPNLQQCLQAGALSRANIARRQMTEGSGPDGRPGSNFGRARRVFVPDKPGIRGGTAAFRLTPLG